MLFNKKDEEILNRIEELKKDNIRLEAEFLKEFYELKRIFDTSLKILNDEKEQK